MKKVKNMNPAEPSDNQSELSQETKNRKKYKVPVLKRHVELSVFQLLLFGVIFATIGAYTLFHGFAASPSDQVNLSSSSVQLIFRFKANATKAQRDNVIRGNNLDIVKEIPQIGVKVVKVPANAADAVRSALSHNSAVDFVEQDRILKPQEQLPNDPYFPTQNALGGGAWGWYQTHTTSAWDITQGSPTINIAILDTGIKTAGLADYNGQIGSTWNVMNNSTDATTNAGNHGTYVAGAVGLAIGNEVGNAGFCPKCKLMVVQVGTDSGALWSDLASGITYAADHGAKVINMSWGGTSGSSALSSAASYAHGKGLVLFAAAGNSNCDCVTYPAATNYVLGVGGTDNIGNKAGDSNYGQWVAVAAPEGNLTGWPTVNGQPGYAPVGGTSLASPVAAGVAGLLFSYNPALTNTQVEAAMENTAVTVPFTVKHGRIDALAALQSLGATDPQASSVPVKAAAPTLYYEINGTTTIAPLTTAPQVGQVLVRGIGGWTGSSPLSVTGLQWQRCDSNGNNCTAYNCSNNVCTIISQSTTYTVQSADVGSTIKLVFSVKNGLGSTPASVLSGVVGGSSTPLPTVLISASPPSITAGQSSTLSWSSTNATSCTASGAWSGSQGTSGSVAVSPTANATYSLTCTGSGGSASASATILVAPTTSPPATPAGLAPTPLDSAVTLTWNANTESDLASYDLQYKPSSGSSWTLVSGVTTITRTVSSLTNGTSYDFQVRSRNTSGQTSAWSSTVSATPQGSQPTDITAPTVTINNPVNGSSIAGSKKVNISASATDNNVVIKVELYIDGQLKTTVTATTLNYNWSINKTVKSGSHTIIVKAYDAANNAGTSTVTVTK